MQHNEDVQQQYAEEPVLWALSGSCTAQGPRAYQEDAVGANPESGVYVVADGLGGHGGGDVASQAAVRSVLESGGQALSTAADVVDAARKLGALADASVRQAQHQRMNGCRTTLALLVLRAGGTAVAWAGDSRVYRYRGTTLERLTSDHRWGRHSLTRCLGATRVEDSDVEVRAVDAQPGDVFLLATDGVADVVYSHHLAAAMSYAASGPQLFDCKQRASMLVREALQLGSRDNCTALVVLVP